MVRSVLGQKMLLEQLGLQELLEDRDTSLLTIPLCGSSVLQPHPSDGGTQGGSVRFLFPPTLHLLLLLYQLHTVDVEESLKSLPVIAIVMVKNLLFVCSLAVAIFTTALGFKIQNKHVGKCLQVQEGTWGGRVSLGECSPYSPMQEWLWIPESQALSSHHTGECLTAPEGEYEGVHLQPCMFKMDSDETGDRVAAVDVDSEEGRQTWSCSKKGLLTLSGRGLHLSASPQSTLVFVSRDHKQGSRWRTLDNQTLCNLRDHKHHQSQDQSHHYIGKSPEARIFPSSTADLHKEAEPFEDRMDNKAPETYFFTDGTVLSQSTNSSADPKMIFLSMDYGMAWKITMLVLSSLALVLGTVILIVNVHSNRRKKVVCVLKSYAVRPERSVPGSPVPSERAPLTEHAMRLPQSSPTLQRGEILIQWKDGSVTPLYEA